MVKEVAMSERAKEVETTVDGLWSRDFRNDLPITAKSYLPDAVYTSASNVIFSEDVNFMRFGNCKHKKQSRFKDYSYRELALPFTGFDPDNPSLYGTRRSTAWGNYCAPDSHYEGLLNLQELADTYSGMALEAMMPSMTSGFSLSNFLVELAEFKYLFNFLRPGAKTLENMASGHLTWSFGWKLFFKDIKALYTQLSSWYARYSKFLNDANKINTRHWFIVIDPPDIPIYQPNAYWRVPGSGAHWSIQPVYTATVKYTYTLPGMSKWQQELRAYLDAIGLHFNAAVVWEAIPFSFVVDWFFDVGNFLGQYSKDWLEPNLIIIDFCSSLKYELLHTYDVEFLKADGSAISGVYPNGWKYLRSYERLRHIPSDFFGVQASGRYGLSQLALSGSLLIALRGRR
jgi:hypothetical protein